MCAKHYTSHQTSREQCNARGSHQQGAPAKSIAIPRGGARTRNSEECCPCESLFYPVLAGQRRDCQQKSDIIAWLVRKAWIRRDETLPAQIKTLHP